MGLDSSSPDAAKGMNSYTKPRNAAVSGHGNRRKLAADPA